MQPLLSKIRLLVLDTTFPSVADLPFFLVVNRLFRVVFGKMEAICKQKLSLCKHHASKMSASPLRVRELCRAIFKGSTDVRSAQWGSTTGAHVLALALLEEMAAEHLLTLGFQR